MCQVTVYAFPEYCWGITLPILVAGYGAIHMQCTCNAHATCCHAHAAMHMLPCTCCHASCVTGLSFLCMHYIRKPDMNHDPILAMYAFDFRSPQTLLLTPLTVYLTPPQVLYLPPLHPARLPTGHVLRAAHLRSQCRLLPGEIHFLHILCRDIVNLLTEICTTFSISHLLRCQVCVMLSLVRTCLGGDLFGIVHVGLAAWPKCPWPQQESPLTALQESTCRPRVALWAPRAEPLPLR